MPSDRSSAVDDVSSAVSDEGLQRLHPLSPLTKAAVFVPTLAFGVLSSGRPGTADWVFMAAATALFVVPAVWAHRFQRWGFDGRVLVHKWGWIHRSSRSVDADRIQQVDLRRNVVQRLLGLAEVHVESASGASGSDITLSALAEDDAQRLRDRILTARDRAVGAEEPDGEPAGEVLAPGGSSPTLARSLVPGTVIAHMTTREAVLSGVTGGDLVRVLAYYPAVQGALVSLDPSPAQWGLLSFGLLAASLAFAAGRGYARYGDFELGASDDEVGTHYGVLSTHSESTPRHRLQTIRISESLLRRWLGAASIRLAAAGQPDAAGAGRMQAPFLQRDTAYGVLAHLWPDSIDIGPIVAAPDAAVHRARFRWTAGPALLSLGASITAVAAGAPALHTAWLLPVLGFWFGTRVGRGFGHVSGNGFVVAREGVVTRETGVVPAAKAQTVRVRSTPFQRRRGLADLLIDVAGASPLRTRELPLAVADRLAGELSGVAR